MLARLLSEYSWVLVLVFAWIITRIRNSWSASTKIGQKQQLFPQLTVLSSVVKHILGSTALVCVKRSQVLQIESELRMSVFASFYTEWTLIFYFFRSSQSQPWFEATAKTYYLLHFSGVMKIFTKFQQVWGHENFHKISTGPVSWKFSQNLDTSGVMKIFTKFRQVRGHENFHKISTGQGSWKCSQNFDRSRVMKIFSKFPQVRGH